MLTGARLLVVDDEADVEVFLRHGFRVPIRQHGWHLEFARNGAEALQRMREAGEFDAVLTDINMPVMDGLTLLREMETLEHDTKAIVISAYSDMPNIRLAMQLGAIDFITKPIEMTDLVATVTKTAAVTRRLKLARQLEIQKAQIEAHRDALAPFLKIAGHDLRDPLAAFERRFPTI